MAKLTKKKKRKGKCRIHPWSQLALQRFSINPFTSHDMNVSSPD